VHVRASAELAKAPARRWRPTSRSRRVRPPNRSRPRRRVPAPRSARRPRRRPRHSGRDQDLSSHAVPSQAPAAPQETHRHAKAAGSASSACGKSSSTTTSPSGCRADLFRGARDLPRMLLCSSRSLIARAVSTQTCWTTSARWRRAGSPTSSTPLSPRCRQGGDAASRRSPAGAGGSGRARPMWRVLCGRHRDLRGPRPRPI